MPATFCIGCGRVDAPQLCPQGCDERAVDLVFGDALDAALAELADAVDGVRALRGLVLRSVSAEVTPRAVQAEARSVLRVVKASSAGQVGTGDGVIRFTAWVCGRCGWMEAPQPCLGVCVFRPVWLVAAQEYDTVRSDCLRAVRRLGELTALVGQLAWVTPRAGEWEESRRVWEARARSSLAGDDWSL